MNASIPTATSGSMTERISEESPVLILTQPFDPTADYVVEALHKVGTPVFRCDPGDFPQRLTLTATLDSGWSGSLRMPGRELRLEQVRCVYYRRPTMFDMPADMSGPERRWANREARAGLGGVVLTLPRWLNHPHHIVFAEYKPVQLAYAAACGLAVPPTVVTNDPHEARSFLAAAGGTLVYKPLAAANIAEEDRNRTIFTTVLGELSSEASIAHTAHMFQRWVPKKYEVRLTVVDRMIFGARIDAHSSAAAIDWRTDYGQLTYLPIEVPAPISQAVCALLARLNLRFGAFDFVVTPDDEWVFLEVNPNGQWAWIEDETGLPIADAIAAALSGGVAE
jgi:ATP-grasp ribosomal peptide maturase